MASERVVLSALVAFSETAMLPEVVVLSAVDVIVMSPTVVVLDKSDIAVVVSVMIVVVLLVSKIVRDESPAEVPRIVEVDSACKSSSC
jgi:hypothetical protein